MDGIPRNMRQACATYLIARELGRTTNVALRLQVEGGELVRRLLARAALEGHADAFEMMRPLVDHVSREPRRAVDLTSLGVAFGATPQPPTPSG